MTQHMISDKSCHLFPPFNLLHINSIFCIFSLIIYLNAFHYATNPEIYTCQCPSILFPTFLTPVPHYLMNLLPSSYLFFFPLFLFLDNYDYLTHFSLLYYKTLLLLGCKLMVLINLIPFLNLLSLLLLLLFSCYF